MASDGDQSTLSLSEIDKWLAEGRALREKLVRERQGLVARVAEIDRALAALHIDDPRQTVSADEETLRRDRSLPQIVLEFLDRPGSRLATAPEILEHVESVRPGTEPGSVHAAIYRLQKSEKIVGRGAAGSRRYSLKGGR